MLKEFTVSARWWTGLWGSGHTAATDPTAQGWIVRRLRAEDDTVLIGQRGLAGCATVRPLGNGKLDVAVYAVTPEEVEEALNGPYPDQFWGSTMFEHQPEYSGWGLTVIEKIQKIRQS